MAKRLTLYILIGLVAGLLVGWALNAAIADGTPAAADRLEAIAGYLKIVTTVFLSLIKMIIAPLVFGTLLVGIAHMGDTGALGRIGLRSLGWFVSASLISLTLGLILVHILQPGVGLNLPLPPATEGSGLDRSAFDVAKIITHIFPTSVIDAMAKNDILQIVVFSVFAGVAITAVGERAAPLVKAAEALVAVMLQITDYVMRFAPFAVFAAVAATIAEQGLGVIGNLAYFMGSVYIGLALLWCVLIALCFLFVGGRTRLLLRYIREPALLAFSTASSEAAFPRTLEALDRFGVPPRIASFVLPLGYSFNLDGSMMYMTFASLFIAQAYGIDLPLGTQIAMLLTLMITSKGIAGVPRASLVVIAATLSSFNIPEAGLLLILAIDHFLDMGRSATNVLGNAVAASVVARWEGPLDPREPAEQLAPVAPSGGGVQRDDDSFAEASR
ncbi:dicarboxylate/amino acid:cation symporter [Sphingomonas aracearum]|uniref:Dicarboxylate/amino acid:cation symporter n=1 Tax=Sphingomonas aracearum TaxID=2283317 RepID=A0A369VXB5_9SPHN|nr:dicarboxylate/amino acid:cation symporter [Sphingomonas aracearum]RDE06479.1 dicarboxylate/amino acid:cation symporter [Sphingomonas aracearum]